MTRKKINPVGESEPCNLCGGKFSKHIFTKNNYQLVQCTECNLVYVSNPPSLDELKRMYSFKANFHVEFRSNDIARKYYFSLAQKHFSVLQKYASPGRLLDIGCSAGFFLKVALDCGWEVLGIELSEDSAALAIERYSVPVRIGRVENIQLQRESFDAITLWDFIEHDSDPIRTMRIVHTLLKPGGHLALTTPNIDGLFPKVSYPLSKITGRWRHPAPPKHLFQFSVKTISRLLEVTGFEILRIYHARIPFSYSFGPMKRLAQSPKRLLDLLVFAPSILIGPFVHAGDEILVIAKKKSPVLPVV